MNDRNDNIGVPRDGHDNQPLDGETTPPTNYDGVTTPPTATGGAAGTSGIYGSGHGAGVAQAHSKKSPLNTVIIALVAVIVIALGVIGFLLLPGDDNDEGVTAQETQVADDGQETVTVTEEATAVEATEEEAFDPFAPENEGDYQDRDSGTWEVVAQGFVYYPGPLNDQDADDVRMAAIERIIELAEDPSTPSTMPSTITGINAGGLGEFTCRVDMSNEFDGYWDCRGPESRQVILNPIIADGIPNTGDSTLDRIQQGTPLDPDWKERALATPIN